MRYHDYKILKRLETDPKVNQRQLAQELDSSLGKINYCLNGLIEKGLVKAKRFKQSSNKTAYIYQLTPEGVKAKVLHTKIFLQKKIEEYESLKMEIKQLKKELSAKNKSH